MEILTLSDQLQALQLLQPYQIKFAGSTETAGFREYIKWNIIFLKAPRALLHMALNNRNILKVMSVKLL